MPDQHSHRRKALREASDLPSYNFDMGSVASPDDARAAVRQWAARWRRVTPVLEQERWSRLAAITDRERATLAVELLTLYQPERHGDDGEGLMRIQWATQRWLQQR